jgi:GNAT superfamily N-acetyltransferase
MSENLEILEISVEETYPLRQTVLRPGRPPELSMYPGDSNENTHHFGAILDNEVVGVATIFPEPLPDYDFNYSWRLRGMAVSPEQQGKGIGKLLLQHCIKFVRAKGGDALWCNGRTTVWI